MIKMILIDNSIWYEGVKMISEVLKSNSTLTKLNLSSDEKKRKEKKRKEKKKED